MEGSRPMLVDLQALAAQSFYPSPKRTANGIDQGRVALLLAVLEKRAGLRLYNQDVYVNVAGGLSLDEPAADLAVCLAVASSIKCPSNSCYIGQPLGAKANFYYSRLYFAKEQAYFHPSNHTGIVNYTFRMKIQGINRFHFIIGQAHPSNPAIFTKLYML